MLPLFVAGQDRLQSLVNKPDCAEMIQDGDAQADKQLYAAALQSYLNALNCDSKKAGLLGPRIETVFQEIEAQKESERRAKLAEKASRKIVLAQKDSILGLVVKEREARAEADTNAAIARRQEGIAIKERNAAQAATRKAIANDLLFKAETTQNRSLNFRLLEMASKIDTFNSSIDPKLTENYYDNQTYYSYQLADRGTPLLSTVLSPDGKYLLTTAERSEMKIWDVANKKELLGFGKNFYKGQFSGDGEKIGALTGPNLMIWNTREVLERNNINDVKGLIKDATGDAFYTFDFSPDGKYVVTGSEGGIIKIWAVEAGADSGPFAIFSSEKHESSLNQVTYSKDGTQILSVALGKAIVWDVRTKKEVFSFKGHAGDLRSARFSPDGTQIVSAASDKTIKVWDVNTRQQLYTLSGHTNEVYDAQFFPDASKILSVSSDYTLKIWDVMGKEASFTLHHHTSPALTVSMANEGLLFASGSKNGELVIWTLPNKIAPASVPGISGELVSATLSADGTKVVVASKKIVQVWDLATKKLVEAFQGEANYRREDGVVNSTLDISSAKLFPGDSKIAFSSGGSVKLWDRLSRKIVQDFPGDGGKVQAFGFSADGKILWASFREYNGKGRAKVWDVSSGEVLFTETAPFEEFLSVDLSADGRDLMTLAEIGSNGTAELKVWDVQRKKEIFTHRDEKMAFNLAALSKDGRRVVATMEALQNISELDISEGYQVLRAWDVKKKTKIHEDYQFPRIGNLALSPNGSQILTTWAETAGGGIHDIGEEGYTPIRKKRFREASYSNKGAKIVTIAGNTILMLDRSGKETQSLDVRVKPQKAAPPTKRKGLAGILAEAEADKIVGPISPKQIEAYNLQEIIAYLQGLEKR